MPRVFISYRRSDSVTITGRIYDHLVHAFGDDSVFKDVDDIPLGVDFRRKLVKRYNLRRMIAYGRIPGYSAFSGKLTADEYVAKVIAGEMRDLALNAHLKAGYRVERVVLNLMRDQSSLVKALSMSAQ